MLASFTFMVESRKHGRGSRGAVPGRRSRGAVPASDVAGHGDTRATPLPARPAMCLFFFLADLRRRYSDSARFTLNRADSGHIERNGRFRPRQRRNRHGKGGGCCFSFLFFFFRHGRGSGCFFFVLSACSSSSPFFVLSVLFSYILNFPCLVLCFVNLAREWTLPCFMFVNLAREWMLEMIKRFDKTLFLRATRNI